MIALLLVLCLFLFIAFLGQAVVSLFKPRNGILWSWFVAPAVGLSVVILGITRLNVWGIPVATAGPWLTAGLAVFTAAVLFWRRPTLPWRKLLPFVLVVCGYLIYTGWPMLRFGFNWISYGNDDMANYCLAADRFLQQGYYDLPLQTELEGSNYAQHYWFMHALQQIRPGSELVIAWVASLTGRHAHEVFMPSILMLSAMQIFALGALGIHKGRNRRVVFIGFLLFATSPLFGLGTLYQLIAQVAGIGILLAVSSLTLVSSRLNLRRLGITGILTGCLGVLYPEVAPFVALSILLVLLRLYLMKRATLSRYVLWIGGVAIFTFIVIASNTYQFINTLVMQSTGSAGLGAMAEINDQSGGLVLFPWTLVPSFIPMLVGLHPFGVVGQDPLISIQIVVGFLVLGFITFQILRNAWRDEPVGYVGVVMLGLGTFLFTKGQDFGLFKLAMFAQPVITLVLAQGFASLIYGRWRRAGRVGIATYMVCTVPSHVYYSYASLGTYGGGLTEVVGASKLGVNFELPKHLKFDAIESDISNVVSAKMLAQYTQGIDTRFLSRSYMDNIANIAVLKFLRDPNPDLGPQARLVEKLSLLRFMLPDELMKGDVPDYRVMSIQKLDNNWTETSSRHLSYNDRLFVAVRTDLDHFNKLNPGDGWEVKNMYQYKLLSQVKDRLVFTHSELSPHYYSAARFKAAFFQREPEPITRGDSYFHGTGRFTTFQVINPSPKLRVAVDFSRTSLGTDRTKLPTKAIVVGREDYPIPFVGSGSARIYTDIIEPEVYEQQSYITVDFGDQPATIVKEKDGLMRLYGRQFFLDDRRLVGFTRDISVIPDEQYQNMKRPTRINQFPEDLARYPGLEYSGLYEDGWVAEDSFFRLGASKVGQVLTLRGEIPTTPAVTRDGIDLTVSINGKPTEIVHLGPGEFTLTRMITEASSITSIALHFSSAHLYGKADERYVSANIHEISVNDLGDLASFRQLTNQKGDRFELQGIDADGWMEQNASFQAPLFDEFKVLKVDVEMPGWASLASQDVVVKVDGQVVQEVNLPKMTVRTLFIPLPSGAQHQVTFTARDAFPLPKETRSRALLVRNLSFESLSKTDTLVRGWHPSGYLFRLSQVDTDGWVQKKVAFTFPATAQFKRAVIKLVRFPSPQNFDLQVTEAGQARTQALRLDTVEEIVVPLSSTTATELELATEVEFALGIRDPRLRSFRIVDIVVE